MPLFRLNIVFHKFLVPECYEELSPETLAEHIRFMAVNSKIPKQIPLPYKPLVIAESSLPWYDPFMQHNRFCETSAFFHAWRNPTHFLEQPYIGFFHYDMILKKEALDFITKHVTAAEAAGKKIVFAPYCLEARQHLSQILSFHGWDRIVGGYNSLYGTSHTVYSILDRDIPLYHTFVMHKELFHRMMGFAELIIPRLFQMIGYNTQHLPFMIERMHGVFLALQHLDGATGEWLPLPGVLHEDRFKDAWQKTTAS